MSSVGAPHVRGRPQLSVVVTIVDGGPTLARCLQALIEQDEAPELEILVPFDDSVPDAAAQAASFPAVRFLSLGSIATRRSPLTPGGQHELIDRRRAAGLAAARSDLVAIVEDRGVPRSSWAAAAARLHAALPHAAIGGAIENARDRPLHWAVYLCDFGRYQLPFDAGPRRHLSDVNVCYKRHALARTEPIWRERYHEPLVHDALLAAGETLYLAPQLVVDQNRGDLHLRELLVERLAWGRLYGSIRARSLGSLQKGVLLAAIPLLPAVLFLRMVRDRAVKRTSLARFVAASPAILLLLTAWSLGEALGYAGREDPRQSVS